MSQIKRLISHFKNVLIFFSWILMGAGFMLALEVDTNIPSLTAYLRQLIFTVDGTPSWTKTIIIDWVAGNGDFLGDMRVRGALNINLWAISDGTIIGADIKDWSINSADIALNSITRSHLNPTIRTRIDNGLLYPISSSTSAGVDWQCWSADGGSYTTQPTIDLCSVWSVNWVDTLANDWSWNWLCLGSNWWTDASCSATKQSVTVTPVNWQCWSADGGSYTTQPTIDLCSVWSVNWVDTLANDWSWNWLCLGSNWWTDASCSATKQSVTATPVNWQCWSANGGSYTTQPTTNLCSVWTVSRVDAIALDWSWNWQCLGSNWWADASCFADKVTVAVNGQCWSADGGSYYSKPVTNLCSVGTVRRTDGYAQDWSWDWLCLGSNWWADALCSALYKLDGKCWSADGGSYTTQPSTNLCLVWIVAWTDRDALDGTRNWMCLWTNWWIDAFCFAGKTGGTSFWDGFYQPIYTWGL